MLSNCPRGVQERGLESLLSWILVRNLQRFEVSNEFAPTSQAGSCVCNVDCLSSLQRKL